MDGKIKGRGALSNAQGRFARYEREPDLEALAAAAAADEEAEDTKPPTHLHIDHARTIIARNQSPDIPFDQSINPYKGCEHGCIYCYARATHSYLDLSPGRDFDSSRRCASPWATKSQWSRGWRTRTDMPSAPTALSRAR